MLSTPSFNTHVGAAAGTRIHYIEAGSGELVMLIHGSLCDYRYWRWQMEAFSLSFHVVAPSLPGCWPEAVRCSAQSDGARDGITPERATAALQTDTRFSMEQHVQSVLDLCRQLSPDRPVHLVGHSRGAQVALEAALAMPGRVGRLVLADPGFPFADEATLPPMHAQIAARLGTAPLDDVISEFIDAVNGPGTWRRTVSWFKDMVRANAWTLTPQLKDIHRSVDARALSGALSGPVLLVGGEFSPPRYGSRIDRLGEVLPQARRVVISRAAHGMNLANARHFNDAVLHFLSDAAS